MVLPADEALKGQGQKLLGSLNNLIDKQGVNHIVSTAGHPSWSFLLIKDVEPYSQWEIKTLFLQEMFARGILTFGTHNMSYSHSDTDLNRLFAAYNEVFHVIKDAVENRKMKEYLRCKPLEPLFKVR